MKTLLPYKRKEKPMTTHNPPIEPSLKRFCASPSEEDSSFEPLSAKADDPDQSHHDSIMQNPPPIEPSISAIPLIPKEDSYEPLSLKYSDPCYEDSNPEGDCLCDGDDCNCEYEPKSIFPYLTERIKAKMPTANDCNKYDQQAYFSQGFDVTWSRLHEFSCGAVAPVAPGDIYRYHEKYQRYMVLAADKARKDGLLLGGQVLVDFHLVKANQRDMGCATHRYITFIAKGSLDCVFRCYQAKVIVTFIYNPGETIQSVWLKDERGTAEDIKQMESTKGSNVDRFYMNAFCAIEPVDRTELTLENYLPLMEGAACSYKEWSGHQLEDLQIAKADVQYFGLAARYFLTFTAKCSSLYAGEPRCYRAKVTEIIGSEVTYTVESVGLHDPADEWGVKYWKEIEAKKGFELSPDKKKMMMELNMMNGGVIMSVDAETIKKDKHEEYKHFMGKAAEKVCEDSGRKEELDDLQMVKANQQVYGHAEHHYITFTARCSLDGKVRCYQAKVTRIHNYDCDFEDDDCEEDDSEDESELEPVKSKWVDRVEFVWLKHGDGLRYRQQIEEAWEESVSAEDIELKQEEYMHMMRTAAEKACYKDWGGQVLKDMQMVTAKRQVFGHTTISHYITFTANGSLDGKVRWFEAKVTCDCESILKYGVEYCLCG